MIWVSSVAAGSPRPARTDLTTAGRAAVAGFPRLAASRLPPRAFLV